MLATTRACVVVGGPRPPRARLRARAPSRGAALPTSALPPANEVAGFVIGAGLVALVFAASRLDGAIAKAQVRGFEEAGSGPWKAESRENGGNIFTIPDDEEEGKGEKKDAR